MKEDSTPAFMCTWRPSMMLSSTVMPANSAMFWKVRAIPSAAICAGRAPVMSLPSKVIEPVSGW